MIESAVRTFGAIFLVAFVLVVAAPASHAQQQCPAMLTVQWWDDIDSKHMTLYVNARHDGDWDAYIEKWQNHLEQVRAVHTRGGAVASKKLGIRIKGRQLYEYILAVEKRLTVTKCLAELEMATAAKKLEGLETASGGEDPLPETVR